MFRSTEELTSDLEMKIAYLDCFLIIAYLLETFELFCKAV